MKWCSRIWRFGDSAIAGYLGMKGGNQSCIARRTNVRFVDMPAYTKYVLSFMTLHVPFSPLSCAVRELHSL